MSHHWVWFALFTLGCYHGLNPGMGWLFAVALGLQDKSVRSVFAALPPIVLGHLVSIASLVVLATVAELFVPQGALRAGAAALLLTFGLYRLVRARHVRWVGMRVGFAGLGTWAFLMATGHGAGLMLLPFLTGSMDGRMPEMHVSVVGSVSLPALPLSDWPFAVAVHTFGYILTMTAVAWVVFDRVGVRILRATWFNFDLVWAVALIASGLFVLIV